MDRSAFIKTLKGVLKYDRKYKSIESRDQLLRLLGRARVNFVPQYGFANHELVAKFAKGFMKLYNGIYF